MTPLLNSYMFDISCCRSTQSTHIYMKTNYFSQCHIVTSSDSVYTQLLLLNGIIFRAKSVNVYETLYHYIVNMSPAKLQN